MSDFLPRRLCYLVDREEREVQHKVLLELIGNVVLLGEAGGGKPRLTEWLGEQDG